MEKKNLIRKTCLAGLKSPNLHVYHFIPFFTDNNRLSQVVSRSVEKQEKLKSMSCKLRTWKKTIRAAKIEEKNLLKPVKSKTSFGTKKNSTI